MNKLYLKKSFVLLVTALFLVGGFFVVNKAFAVVGEGTATINSGANVTVEKSTSNVFTVVLTVGASGITANAENPTFTIPTGFTAPNATPVANAGLVVADGDWSVIGGATCLVDSPAVGLTAAVGQVITVDVSTACTVGPGGTITLTYKGTSATAMEAAPLNIGVNDVISYSPVTLISTPPTITVTDVLAQAYTQTDFTAFDGVNIKPVGTNFYTVSSGTAATYISGAGTVSDPVNLTLTGYAPIVIPWFGQTWTTYNYVTVGIKLPTGFTGTRIYQVGLMRYDVDPNGIYSMGVGSTDLATGGAASGYLDYSFAANSNNTKKNGLVKLQVIWTNGATPEYFTIDINGLQTGPVFIDTNKNGTFDSGEQSFNTIQAAINAASSGDTIKVTAGTYKEQVNITKGVTLIGDVANPDNVIIDGENKTNLSTDGQVRIYNPSGPVVFKGFKIINGGTSSSGGYYAILTKGNFSRTIQDNKLIGHGASVGLGDDYGIWANTATGELTVDNNYLTNFYHGILLEQQYGATTIENNTFDALYTGLSGGTKYGGRAIEAINYGSTDVTSLQKFSGNKFLNFVSTGIQITGGFSSQTPRKFTNVLIDNNNFDFSTTDISNLHGAIYLANVSGTLNNDPNGGVTAAINNNYIHVPSGSGVIIIGLNGSISLSGNSIVGNLVKGLKADESLGSVINATNNWWGSASPVFASIISGSVTYDPYYINASMTTTNVDLANTTTREATSNSTTPEVVIINPIQAVNVTIDSGTTNPTLNFDALITNGTGTLPVITITSANANNTNVEIPATTVTGPTGWDGVIAAPTVTTVNLPTTPGQTKTLSTAIEVGSTVGELTFSKAVRILLPGQASKRAGYVRNGIPFTEITNVCATDDQATGDALTADKECKINVGADLVIWTKHFTTFATYTQTTNPVGSRRKTITPDTTTVSTSTEVASSTSITSTTTSTTTENIASSTKNAISTEVSNTPLIVTIVKNIVPIVANILTAKPPLSGIVSKPIVVTTAPENPPLFDVISQPVPPTPQNRTPFIVIAIVAWILIASVVLLIVRRITSYLLIMKAKKDMLNAKIKKNENIH